MAGLGDFVNALAMRDTIMSICKSIIDTERPRYRYGTVQSIDELTGKCQVVLVGQSNAIPVSMGSIRPTAQGQRVRVGGIGTDKFIEDVYGVTSSRVPSGSMMDFGGTAAPDGWLLCNGQLVDKTTYADLFGVIGHYHNGGNDPGNNKFKLPDFRDRGAVGVSSSKTLGSQGGADSTNLTQNQLPSHSHTMNHSHTGASAASAGDHTHGSSPALLQYVGSGGNVSVSTSGSNTQGTYSGVNNAGAHTHDVSIPAYSGSTGSTGSGAAVPTQDKYLAVPKIIKI